jgi:hypothetical protein
VIRRWLGRLRILWIQKVHKRSGRFDRFNDPVFKPINKDQSGPQRPD